jgi:hypothetical protein
LDILSLKPTAQAGKTAAVRVAIAAVFILLLTARGRAQEPASWADDQRTVQEKIYQSRGADVPDGYVTDRGLSQYAELLPSDFCDALGRLDSSDRWLDIGAGEGQAILDYYAVEDDTGPLKKCAPSITKARAVAISIEDRRTDMWRRYSAGFGSDRLCYLSGKRLREYSEDELGKFQIITDVYGGFSYSQDLSLFMEKTLSFLQTGGVFYTMLQNVHLENGKNKPDTSYQTELVDTSGRDLKVCAWLKQAACVEVGCESNTEWGRPTEIIKVRKLCNAASIPPLKLLKFVAGNPPSRRYQLER